MNRLWVRLSLAFALVALLEVLLAGLLASRQVATGFRRFVAHSVVQGPAPEWRGERGLMGDLVTYYRRTGAWSGVGDYLSALGVPSQRPGAAARLGVPDVTLADVDGRVVFDGSGRYAPGTTLADAQRRAGLSVVVDGRVVGYLLPEFVGPGRLTAPAQEFLIRVNRALLQAGALAAGLGILIGIAIARGVSRPLSHLANAARSISRGDLQQRVVAEGSREIVDLAAAFNDMAAELHRAEQLRKNMVADVAHELRTPLSVIRGNLRAILDDVYPLDKAEIAVVYDETLLLGRLIDDLRELALAEAGQISLHRMSIDVAATIGDAIVAFVELGREAGVELRIEAPDDLPAVEADPERVAQVVRNLVDNALRHTPAGGQVVVRAQRHTEAPGYVRISVCDTGSGIPAEQLPHVFDRFWRADPSRSREHGGSGLGLAVARQLVEAQGGQIWVESEPGYGSQFHFTLPVTLPTPA